ncbi:alpha/beta fold hydrolase [Nesterenkonia alkaliphila]|nr:alpha/beta fold hydrolase [Nesterenkonia alkaliphila]GFZ96395.1 hypothetical protein GCM10011359_27290 [Nesterenkonia alkaliphila]
MSHYVLVPGLWLDASSWKQVVPHLESAGHTTAALTFPTEPGSTLQDWISTVTDAVDTATEPSVLVGHSAGCGLTYAAVDARSEKVKHLVLIGGFPLPDGMPLLAEDFPETDGLIHLPEFSAFSEEDLAGLDDAILEQFRNEATPVPATVLDSTLELKNTDRHRVPTTAVCTEYSAADLQKWTEAGFPPTTEFPKLEDLRYIDLPTGHWPQFSRPEDLAKLLLRLA